MMSELILQASFRVGRGKSAILADSSLPDMDVHVKWIVLTCLSLH